MRKWDKKGDSTLEGRRQTLLSIWKELREHARQHEAQRAVATNMILVLASADVGIMATLRFDPRTVPLAVGLVALGLFGFLLSAKHYDRAEWSTSIALAIERRLDELDPGLSLEETKQAGRSRHFRDHPVMTRVRLNKIWSTLHLLLALAGVAAVVASLS